MWTNLLPHWRIFSPPLPYLLTVIYTVSSHKECFALTKVFTRELPTAPFSVERSQFISDIRKNVLDVFKSNCLSRVGTKVGNSRFQLTAAHPASMQLRQVIGLINIDNGWGWKGRGEGGKLISDHLSLYPSHCCFYSMYRLHWYITSCSRWYQLTLKGAYICSKQQKVCMCLKRKELSVIDWQSARVHRDDGPNGLLLYASTWAYNITLDIHKASTNRRTQMGLWHSVPALFINKMKTTDILWNHVFAYF